MDTRQLPPGLAVVRASPCLTVKQPGLDVSNMHGKEET